MDMAHKIKNEMEKWVIEKKKQQDQISSIYPDYAVLEIEIRQLEAVVAFIDVAMDDEINAMAKAAGQEG